MAENEKVKRNIFLHPNSGGVEDTNTILLPETRPQKASDINSQNASNGEVLTADGQGGASWQTPPTVTIDSALDPTSENPVKNKAVTEALSAVRGLSGTATLLANDWVNNEQSLVLSELGDDDAVFFYPSSSTDKELLESANVFVSASYSTVTFSAETIPSSDISLYYFIARGA